jgi:HSP20 family molecular chaperone IbpA
MSREPRDIETREKQVVAREGTRPGPRFQPDVDIVERSGEFVVTADLPGVDERHVNVRLENGVLSIDGSLAVEPDPAWTPRHVEYRIGGYHREFTVSEAIDAARIQASMRDGVLELRLPKTERHRPRQIEVRAG